MARERCPKFRKLSFFQLQRTTLSSQVNNAELFDDARTLRKGSADMASVVPSNYKTQVTAEITQVCKYWEEGAVCPFADSCNYAHGGLEKRNKESPSQKYKTKPCKNYHLNQFCPYGQRCQFIHNGGEGSGGKIKLTLIYAWFGDQLPLLLSLRRQRRHKGGGSFSACFDPTKTQDPHPSSSSDWTMEDSDLNHRDMSGHEPQNRQEILFNPGFVKPRLYSL